MIPYQYQQHQNKQYAQIQSNRYQNIANYQAQLENNNNNNNNNTNRYSSGTMDYYSNIPANQAKNIAHEILCDEDLSRAGILFSLSNEMLLSDFPTTINILKSIIDNKIYINNINQQSIVEIALTKYISALK